MSPLCQLRLQYTPKLPDILHDLTNLKLEPSSNQYKTNPQIASLFPCLSKQPGFLKASRQEKLTHQKKIVGVLLSGGQAAGGHNVIAGLFDALKKLHPESRLIGFLDGPKGLIENHFLEITEEKLAPYRNQGGFDLIGSGRKKIESESEFNQVLANVKKHNLNGLVITGGDDSNTNAALLVEFFLSNGCPTKVIGVPKTIDGDLKNEDIEISFGFDSATKTYAEAIGNLARDALSSKKYYFFIKLMGRSASHITLECALKTHPNLTFIGEEIASQKKSLKDIVHEISNLICQRAVNGKNYGIILIPEGIIEFIPEIKNLISELQRGTQLSKQAEECLRSMPQHIQEQLTLDLDAHGNVQISKVETERMLIEMVSKELDTRHKKGNYNEKFNAQPIFYGYEGRSCLPTNFDATYCYTLGCVAALLLDQEATGYLCSVKNLTQSWEKWEIGGRSLVTMLSMENRKGKEVPVIAKALVNLNQKAYQTFLAKRNDWALEDMYQYPGPIQYSGSAQITDSIPEILRLGF